jgi:tetratricopeptide (TPR) repeat protein
MTWATTDEGREPSLTFGLARADEDASLRPKSPASMSFRPELLSIAPDVLPQEATEPAADVPPVRERRTRADWFARGVGVAALVASVLVLYQQSRSSEPGSLAPAALAREGERSIAAAQTPSVAKEQVVEQAPPEPGAVAFEAAAEVEEFALDEIEAQEQTGADGERFRERLEKASAVVDEGLYYARQKNYRMAVLRYRQALEIVPSYLRALRLLTRASMQLLDKTAAVDAAERLVKAHPEESSHHLMLGDACHRAGMPERAQQAWRAAAESGNALARKRLNGDVAAEPEPDASGDNAPQSP